MDRRSFIAGVTAGATVAAVAERGGTVSAAPADLVLSGAVNYPTGFTIPAGETWEMDPTVSTTITCGGNIIVNGTLRAEQPEPGVAHRIQFVGINEANIVGGHTMAPVASDVGLWVDGGVLDIQGRPVVSWNRTGSDPTWLPGDDLYAMPIEPGEFNASPFTGGPVGAASSPLNKGIAKYARAYTYDTEVVNLSRSFTIESVDGRAHVMFINLTKPQRMNWVELRNLGPAGKLGRYPLHLHHNGEGSNGSQFLGNIARNSGNHAYVPHLSNGIDFSGCVAWSTEQEAFWWDAGDKSNRIRWDRCGAYTTRNGSAFELGTGVGNSVLESWAVNTKANSSHAGFRWPSTANSGGLAVWNAQNCRAHNNDTHGVRVWQNNQNDHTITGFASFHNARNGFSHGAYRNRYRYSLCVGFGNAGPDFAALAVGHIFVANCNFGTVTIGDHSQDVEGDEVVRFEMGPQWQIGRVVVSEAETSKRGVGRYLFDSNDRWSDLTAANFVIVSQLSPITIDNHLAADFTLTP